MGSLFSNPQPVPAHSKKFRVAIIGGGLGGLSTALAISQLLGDAVDIQIYEATGTLTEIGAGIMIWPRTWELLKRLGLEKKLIEILPKPPTNDPCIVLRLRKSDRATGVPFMDLLGKGDAVRFHRAELQKTLIDAIEGHAKIYLSHRLKTYDATNPDIVRLHFENGVTADCDLLIGADGIRSTVRRNLIAKSPKMKGNEGSIDPVWSGTFAYRGLVPLEMLTAKVKNHSATKDQFLYCGKNRHIVAYIVTAERVLNVVANANFLGKEGTPWHGPQSQDVSQAEMKEQFPGWEEDADAILDCISQPKRWAILTVNPLSRYADGRVLLIGDAAHAMCPHLAAAAGQAIEDGFVLAQILSRLSPELESTASIDFATDTYDKIRRPLANSIQWGSRMQGIRCQFREIDVNPSFNLETGIDDETKIPVVENDEDMRRLATAIQKEWDWAWIRTAAEDNLAQLDEIIRERDSASGIQS